MPDNNEHIDPGGNNPNDTNRGGGNQTQGGKPCPGPRQGRYTPAVLEVLLQPGQTIRITAECVESGDEPGGPGEGSPSPSLKQGDGNG